ncbi:MAG: hypothetical protein R3D32_03035 [Nitratireductor sp.]
MVFAGFGMILLWGAISGSLGLTSLDPFCKTTAKYEATAVISWQGQQYTSTITRLNRRSRDWIYNLNSNGCGETKGTSHIFRTMGNQAILLNSRICNAAETALTKRKPVDVAKLCERKPGPNRVSGFVIDNADNPAMWQHFWFTGQKPPEVPGYDGIRLVSLTAVKTSAKPSDNYDELVPHLLAVKYLHLRDPDRRPFHPCGLIAHSRGKSSGSGGRRQIPYGEFLK